jgi:HK97 family phage prohead protease
MIVGAVRRLYDPRMGSVWNWVRTVVLGEPERADHAFHADTNVVDLAISHYLGRGFSARAGRSEALTVPAMLKGRNMICSVSTLPLVEKAPDRSVVRNPLLEQIDPDVPNVVTLAMTVEDLVFEGISWWRVLSRDSAGFPVSARHLDYGTVSLLAPTGGGRSPLPGGEDPRGAAVYVDGVPTPARDVIRFDSPNPAVLRVGGKALRKALLLDAAARMYAEDPAPLAVFRPAEGADEIEDEEIKEILRAWRAARRERGVAYVPRALEYSSNNGPSPRELQLAELQQRASLEIANMLGVDPEDLGVSTTSRTYANAVDRRRDRVNDVLAPYMSAVTDRLSMGDVTRRGYKISFVLDDYMKSNPTERWSTYEIAHRIGAKTIERIQEEEGLPAMSVEQDPAPAPEEDGSAIVAAAEALLRLDSGPLMFVDVPVAQFSVNRAERIIEGVALPYGRIGSKGGMRFRFERGSLKWTDPGRVKLLRDHDPSRPLGRAVALTDTPAGLRVRFSIARGAAGDEALELAEDGVLDGLSVGTDFDMAADTVPDPRNRGVTLVRNGSLREVSLTAMPAFDDARLTRVSASLGGIVNCAHCGGTLEPGVAHTCTPANGNAPAVGQPGGHAVPAAPAPAGTLTLSADQLVALMGRNMPGNVGGVALSGQPGGEPGGEPGPTVVDPTRPGASGGVQLTEPAPYRFDAGGNLLRGSHDFSTDLFAASKGDESARERATQFVRAQFDVATTDVNELNPTRQRPDMYVDQREYRYPVWEAINKGSLTDITPFTFPKFSSAADLVAAHAEGVEPSSGTLVTTSQTVTPSANSGKAKITRETWDQGGNPQVSNLVWRQMQRGWFESLEAAAVAVLDAASPTQIDFSGTPGLADDQLDQALTAALASLQFIRGGFSMDTGFAQIDLFKALVAAVDGNGRRLYPALGPQNANGTVRGRWAGVDVNGVAFLPAWALAASGSVSASSYLFDREVVHGWASAPQRLEFNIEVAHVYIGLWGYKATAISDVSGVREIVYDPA